MSMQKIREWMEANPDGAKDVRRQNRSYIFFHEVPLSDKDEAIGAQGVQLTPGRSIAVDKSLHVYGTPFFIAGELPIESDKAKTPFRRLMIAQDTGSAITGPARADLYFGAGPDAGKVSGRLKNNMRFVMLVPKSLDPVTRGRKLPVPDPRPSEMIAKLFPQTPPAATDQSKDAAKVRPKDQRSAAVTAAPTATPPAAVAPAATATASVPLPEPRPTIIPGDGGRRQVKRSRENR
jgi:membrane-bound lytic murein transglycosylase A